MQHTDTDKQGCWRNTYRDAVLRTAGELGNISMGGLGLAGEAGEVADEIKKIAYHAKPFDRDKMVKELGDVRWYLEYVAACWEIPMREIEEKNMEKLAKRYPTGFVTHAERLTNDEEHA